MKHTPVRHRGFRSLLAEAHAAARQAVGKLTPERRGRLSRAGYCHVTHFYSWLRGSDSALSLEALDRILRHVNITFGTGRGGRLVCREARAREKVS